MSMAFKIRPLAFAFLVVIASAFTVSDVTLRGAKAGVDVGVMNISMVADEKPPRFMRQNGESSATAHSGSLGSSLKCGVMMQVNAASSQEARCPEECPIFAQDAADPRHCAFSCVSADQCGVLNPAAPVADMIARSCRSPNVPSCKEYNYDGTDTCAVCFDRYRLMADGQCHYKFMWVVHLLVFGLGFMFIILLAWLIDLGCRENINEAGLKEAWDLRSLGKVRQPRGSGTHGKLWPLFTNLLREEVAGPGIILHFNFQAAVIVWALFVAAVWVTLAFFYPDILILGTKPFGLPRQNCILVAWGHERQHALMWTKVLFLGIVYSGTFGGCILFSIRQLRIFQQLDLDSADQKDFAALICGLPELQGSVDGTPMRWEERIKNKLTDAIEDDSIVGISIAWDLREQEAAIIEAATTDTFHIDSTLGGSVFETPPTDYRYVAEGDHRLPKIYVAASHLPARGEVPKLTGMRKCMYEAEQLAFVPDEKPPAEKEEVLGMLSKLTTSENAFVIFNTEQDKIAAVKKIRACGGVEFEGAKIILSSETYHPNTVQWENFHSGNTSGRTCRKLLEGVGLVMLGLVCWTLFFYVPYTWSILNFNYDNGQQPGIIYGFAFSMVVVIGNQIMYQICDFVSRSIGFIWKDRKEACYMVFFLIACSLNILLDLVTTYFVALRINIGMGFRTYDGTELAKVHDFTAQFDSYGMQRQLGENIYFYAWPSTFLIPFLIEPFPSIIIPLQLGKMIIRSHPELVGRAAGDRLAATPMELGRYADLTLNMLLGIMIFYFPCGYTGSLFLLLALAHLLIYCYDHWRVLRAIPQCNFSNNSVDWCAQVMLAPICGVILSCLVFKANRDGFGYALGGPALLLTCTAAFVLHCVVHVFLLVYVVPLAGYDEVVSTEEKTWPMAAQREACSWFTSNPVHCLRSKYIYEDSPPCGYYVRGKEHCLKENQSIGCHYERAAPKPEEESFRKHVTHVRQTVTSHLSQVPEFASELVPEYARELLSPKKGVVVSQNETPAPT